MTNEASSIVGDFRKIVQDLVTPDLREIKADVRAIRERFDATDKRLDRIEAQLSLYQKVQAMETRLAELEAKQRPSA